MPVAVLIPLLISAGSMGAQMGLSLLGREKPKPTDVGKMDDVRVTGSDYGAHIDRVWGRMRKSGNTIWSNGVQQYTITSGGGGKKGGEGPTNTFTYKTSLGVLIGLGEIDNILRMWADADVLLSNPNLYNGTFQAETATLAGGASTSTSGTGWTGTGYVTNLGSGGKVTFNTSSVTAPPHPRIDPDQTALSYTRISLYYKCASTKTATVTTNSGGGPVVYTTSLAPTGSSWSVETLEITGFATSVEYAYAGAATADLDKIVIEKYWLVDGSQVLSFNTTGAVNSSILYPQNLDDPGEYYNHPLTLTKDTGTGIYTLATPIPGESIRIYSGTETQTADAAIISWLDGLYGAGQGVLRASAMRGLCYVLFENFTLKSSRSPNFLFEVDTGRNTVNDILSDMFTDIGLTAGDYDLTATAGAEYSQIGFAELSATSRKQMADHLCKYHQFRLAEIDGKIRSIPDTGTSIATIDPNLLRAHPYGSEMPLFDAEVTIKEETLMPREVRISIMNPDLEFHNDTATAQIAETEGTESVDYAFPIADTLDNARLKSERMILKAYFENQTIEVSGMPELARYAVGDVFTLLVGAASIVCRVEKKSFPLPIGEVKLSCLSTGYTYAGVTFQSDSTSFAPKAIAQFAAGTFPRNSVAVVIQSVPIFEKDRGRLGVYLAISGRGLGSGQPAAIYREFGVGNYLLQSKVDGSSPVGIAQSTLATGTAGAVDTVHSITIYFFDDISLETVTAGDISTYPTLNLMRVGSEWLQFRTAVAAGLPANSTYRSAWTISNLTRGMFGTAAAVGTHAANEYCAAVTSTLQFLPLEPSDIDTDINIKAVTNGQDIEVAPITGFHFNPLSLYTISNRTEDRTYDANATTINELADVVSTIISDLHL